MTCTVRVLQRERGEKACRFKFCTRIACLVYGADGEESDARHTPKPPKKIIRDGRLTGGGKNDQPHNASRPPVEWFQASFEPNLLEHGLEIAELYSFTENGQLVYTSRIPFSSPLPARRKQPARGSSPTPAGWPPPPSNAAGRESAATEGPSVFVTINVSKGGVFCSRKFSVFSEQQRTTTLSQVRPTHRDTSRRARKASEDPT